MTRTKSRSIELIQSITGCSDQFAEEIKTYMVEHYVKAFKQFNMPYFIKACQKSFLIISYAKYQLN